MKRIYSALLFSGMVIAIIVIAKTSSADAIRFSNKPTIKKIASAQMSEVVSLQAQRQDAPYISLSDGHDLITDYIGEDHLIESLKRNEAKPLSLASADFDEDGVADLIAGYQSPDGRGIVVVHRGNVDAIYPNAPEAQERKANGTFTDAPFLSPALVYAAPEAIDFVGAGDFDGDSHWDVVTAKRGSSSLYLLGGDGKGVLSPEKARNLQGNVTALVVGEVNRRDGLNDIVIGINTGTGAKALVFEGPDGAFKAEPEEFALPAEATSLALGQMDEEQNLDVVIAAGHNLLKIRGRDRKLSLNKEQQTNVERPFIESRIFPFAIQAVATGDFESAHQSSIAMLTDQGEVTLLRQGTDKNRSLKRWKSEVIFAERWNGANLMLPVRVSSSAADDLLVVDTGQRKLHFVVNPVSSEEGITTQAKGARKALSAEVNDEPVAAIAMNLNGDAMSDVVSLRNRNSAITIAPSASASIITVNSVLDTDIRDGVLTLREAIRVSNGDLSLSELTAFERAQVSGTPSALEMDEIRFSITSNIAAAQPDKADDTQRTVSQPVVGFGRGLGLNSVISSGLTGVANIASNFVAPAMQSGTSQWINLGPFGGSIIATAIDPTNSNIIYAGTFGGGIFKTTNGGASWSAVSSGLANLFVQSLAIDPINPNTIYAGTGGGVSKTTNGGLNWNAVNSGLLANTVYDLAIDPTNANTIYAGTDNGVFKTTNGGASWNAINSGLPGLAVFAVAVDSASPNIIYAGTKGGGVFKTTNSGASWNPINSGLSGLGVTALVIDPKNSKIIYAGTDTGGVFKTTNDGGNWEAFNNGLPTTNIQTLAIDPINSNIVYAGTSGGGISKTTNGGAGWEVINNGLSTLFIYTLAIDPTSSGTIYTGTNGGGVFKTTNGGVGWTAINSALSGFTVPGLAIDSTNSNIIYAGTDSGGVFKTTDAGANWNAMNTGLSSLSVYIVAIDPTNSNIIYAGTDNGGAFKSTNGGASWSAINNGLTNPNFLNLTVLSLVIDSKNPNTLYAGTNGSGVFKTTNGGSSWTPVNNGLSGSGVLSLAIDPTNSNTIYAGTNSTGIFKTTNGGTSWNAINSGLTNLFIGALAIDSTNANTVYAGTNGGVFKTMNGGAGWNAINSGISKSFIRAVTIDPTNANTIYAGTLGGVFQSTNGGASWAEFGIGLTNIFTYDLAIDPSNTTKVYAGTGNSVFGISSSGCTYTLSSNTLTTFPISGGFGSVNVNTTAACSWTASSNANWINIISGSGTGTGTVNFNVALNSESNFRTGSITIAGQIFTIRQFGTGGDCAVTPVNFGQPVQGALTNADCVSPLQGRPADRYSFSGTAGQQITIQASSANLDPFLYLIDSNGKIIAADDDGGGERDSRIPASSGFFTLPSSGTFIIEVTSGSRNTTGDYLLSLIQASGNVCKYIINPTTQSFSSAGGSSSIAVIAAASCNWTAVSNNLSFITVTSNAIGSGIGSVNFTVAANNGSTPRTGSITIAGQTFTISQGVGCTYFINPNIQVFSAAGGSGSISVSAPPGCNWIAGSNADFINITAGASGSGSGTVNFNVAANPGSSQRSGTISVAGLVFTVVQSNNQSVKTVDLSIPLPKIVGPIIIDGTSQPGAVIEINASGIRGTEVLKLSTGNSTIRGLAINRFNAPNTNVAGILLSGGTNNIIEGCSIGTNSAGTSIAESPVGNADFSAGIAIRSSNNNRIGGTTAAARNVISGVDGNGIVISNFGVGNRIQGNYIGTDVTGSTSVGNQRVGIAIVLSSNNIIGGTEPGAGNVISGNLERGISITENCGEIMIQGNKIGTDVTGTIKVANRIAGVFLTAKNGVTLINTTIGGTSAAAGNIISGNDGYGLVVSEGVLNTQVQGNFIGINADGKGALGNGYGVIVTQTNAITIGGSSISAKNIISGNELTGIGIGFLIDNKTGGTSSMIQNNFIGGDINGAALGNKQDGIFVEVNSAAHTIVDNRIAFNGTNGIRIPNVTANPGTPGVQIRIESNLIYNNALLGIDLGEAGVTENDPGDTDAGANLQQNYPVLTSANVASATGTVTPQAAFPITINFNSTPNSSFTMQFFFGSSCSGAGHSFSGAIPVRLEPSLTFTTDASGNFSRVYNINIPDNVTGGFVNATATSAEGNTSEFSSCLQIGSGGGGGTSGLAITGTQKSGKHLIILGTGFTDGSKLFVNDDVRKIIERTATSLTGKKVAKGLLPGAKIRVQNPDGSVSNEWIYQ